MVQSDRLKTWTNLLLGAGLTFLFFYMMAPFVVAFLLGAVIAIICNPVAEVLKAKKIPKGGAALLVTGGITLGILVPLGLVLFAGSYRILKLIGRIQIPADQASRDLLANPTVQSLVQTVTSIFPVDQAWIRNQALELVQVVVGAVSRLITHSLANTPSFLLGLFVIIISVFFLLKDGRSFLKYLESLSPIQSSRSRELYQTFEKSCRGVVLSLFGSAVIQGLLMFVFALITGLPSPFLIGSITIIMGMVPIVGAAPVWMFACGYLFLYEGTGLAIVMLIGGLLISTSDNVVRPLIMQGHSQMHPLLALVSVFGAINLVGATGIFLGPIIAAVFVSFLNILASEIRRENLSTPEEAAL